MRILGVDPGATGALFVIDFDLEIGSAIDMPMIELRGKQKIDHAALANVFEFLHDIDLVVIEHVTSSPQMGVASAFSFGQSFSAVVQAAASRGFKYELVAPNLWTRALGVISKAKSKDSARLRANQLMPWLSKRWPLKKHDGRIDAALLAYYGSKLP